MKTLTPTLDRVMLESPSQDRLTVRMRRLRSSPAMRSMVRETHLRLDQLILPLFVVEGTQVRKPINSMPGVSQLSVDNVLHEIEEIAGKGLKSVLLFGIPQHKDAKASQSYHEEGIVQKAIREIKRRFPEIIVVADTCLCEYMDHGHCGIVEDGKILNDPTLAILSEAAVAQAAAGADIIAPSDMMDGRIAAIRAALDAASFQDVPNMAYSAKFASSLYSPFREAAASAPHFGDRTTYQMDPANGRQAIREIELDVAEGADIVMIKPALSYLDIINRARQITNLPIAAYNVSGEFSMVKAAAANGWIDERKVVLEMLTGIVRAGTDLVITYHAKDVANWLKS
jgi:porphobilinogen synthase